MTPRPDLSGVAKAQLQRWAFGRSESDAERDRAAHALAELTRREAAARLAAARGHPPAEPTPGET